MTRVVDLPLDIWETMLLYARSRHYARLWCTGDRSVQTILALVPKDTVCRRNTRSDRTDLVLLLSRSAARLGSLDASRFRTTQAPPQNAPWWRRLVAWLCEPVVGRVDLTAFRRLKSVTLEHVATDALILPPSITKLKLSNFSDGRYEFANAAELTSLTSLGLALQYVSSLPSGDWPPNLTRLEIASLRYMYPRGAHSSWLRAIPATVIHLRLPTAHLRLDWFSGLTNLDGLASLTCETFVVACAGHDGTYGALPPALRALHVADALAERSDRPASFASFARSLPSTMTDLRITRLVGEWTGRSPEDTAEAACRELFPLLCVESLQHVICNNLSSGVLSTGTPVRAIALQWLGVHGLDERFLDLMLTRPPDLLGKMLANDIPADVARKLSSVHSLDAICFGLKTSNIRHSLHHQTTLLRQSEYAVRVGYTRTLFARNYDVVPVSDVAYQNARKLVLFLLVPAVSPVIPDTSFDGFERLERLELRVVHAPSVPDGMLRCIEFVHHNRAYLPYLRRLEIEVHHYTQEQRDVGPEHLRLLAEMRLYLTWCPASPKNGRPELREHCVFTYRVCPPDVYKVLYPDD